jgi:hypothetical protein
MPPKLGKAGLGPAAETSNSDSAPSIQLRSIITHLAPETIADKQGEDAMNAAYMQIPKGSPNEVMSPPMREGKTVTRDGVEDVVAAVMGVPGEQQGRSSFAVVSAGAEWD